MKTIKTLALFVSVCAALLLVAGCDKTKDDGNNLSSKTLGPVDWEGYNDVYTVYWTYTGDCSQFLSRSAGDIGKIIKIAGWLVQPGGDLPEIHPGFFKLIDKPNQIYFDKKNGTIPIQAATREVQEQLEIKFKNSDLTKKCYITGGLAIDYTAGGTCRTIPLINITDADNVTFE